MQIPWATLVCLALVVGAPITTYRIAFGWPTAMRDRTYRAVGLAAALVVAPLDPGLALWLGLVWWKWRGVDDLPMLMSAGTVTGVYFLARSQAAALTVALPPVLMVLCAVQTGWALVRAVRGYRAGWNTHILRDCANGTMGNRVFLGALCALTVPLVPGWWALIPALGVVVSTSTTAALAAVLGWIIVHPGHWWLIPLGVTAFAWGAWRPETELWSIRRWRSSPLDSWRDRVTTWWLGMTTWWHRGWGVRLTGLGYGAVMDYSGWWVTQRRTHQHFKQLHNDWLQHVMEYGLIGALAGALWIGRLGRHMAFGDPYSGALAAVAIVATMQFPLRVASVAVPILMVVGVLGAR